MSQNSMKASTGKSSASTNSGRSDRRPRSPEDGPAGLSPSSSFSTCQHSHDQASTSMEALKSRVNQASTMVAGYVVQVLARAFGFMITPLAIVVHLTLLLLMATVIYRAFWIPTRDRFCQFPGTSWLSVCGSVGAVQAVGPNITMRVDYPGLMALQNDALDRMLVQSNAGSQLALDVKRAEVLVRGLTSYVLHSKLENKALIASSLTQFVGDAKDTGRDLQKLSAKLYGAVASVTAFTEFAGMAIAKTPPGRVNPVLQRMFRTSMEVLSEQVGLSLSHAASAITRLDRLEESMTTIHGILVKEDIMVIEQRNRVAAKIWTRLGWNAEELHLHDTHLKLINSVQDYRVQAFNHVVSTMQTLEAIDAHLVELQSQLSSPGAGVAKPILVEVQLATIQDSVQRLRQQMATTRSHETSMDGLDQEMRSVHLGLEKVTKSGGK